MTWQAWLLLLVLAISLSAVEVVALHAIYTARFPGTADYYSRWAGARALLLEGRDPYSLEVTREIQDVLKIDHSLVGKSGFAYPLYVIFSFWPLIYLPYDWVQAIWMVTLQWLAVAQVLLLLRIERWTPSPLGLGALLLGTLAFYPVTRTIMLGQFTLHVAFFLALTLLALQHQRDGWAGVALAVTTIKPQMVVLIGPWLVLWALVQRRWRLVGGLLAGGGALLLASLSLFPRWPLSFAADVLRYSKVAGGRNPLTVLIDWLCPSAPEAVRYVLTGLLVLVTLAAWLRGLRHNGETFNLALYWTITVSLLILFQTGTTNQVLFLIPFFAWLHAGLKKWGRWWISLGAAILLVGLWALFLGTIHGDWEDPIMFLPLPLLSLAILVGNEYKRWQSKRYSAIVSRRTAR